MYRVIKTIRGRRYHYDQRTWRENGKVKTESIYVGPVDGEQTGTPLLRRNKRDERSFEADLEHAMVMVARLTGRSVDDQVATLAAEFASQDGSAPTISIPSTFASTDPEAVAEGEINNSVKSGEKAAAAGDESNGPGQSSGANGDSDGQGGDTL